MIKTIVTPENNSLVLEIPNSYIGKKIEIMYYALDEITEAHTKGITMGEFWGVISDETAAEMLKEVEQSRESWEERFKKQF